LYPYPDDLVIISKVGALRDDKGAWSPAQTPAELRAGVEDNLKTLGVEQLGAVNIRRMGSMGFPIRGLPSDWCPSRTSWPR